MKQSVKRAAQDVERPGQPNETFGSVRVLEDLAAIALDALQVPLVVIVLDGPVSARSGIAASIDNPWLRANPGVDLASLIDPRIAGAAGLAFYAAVPIRDADGHKVGTVAALAPVEMAVSDAFLVTLHRCARVAKPLV